MAHTGHMSFVWWTVTAGATVPAHSHPHEQVVHMLEGDFELTVDGTTHRMTPGTVVVIPGGITHSARAVSASKLLDVFQPVREDYQARFGA